MRPPPSSWAAETPGLESLFELAFLNELGTYDDLNANLNM